MTMQNIPVAGGSMPAYITLPAGDGPHPALILLQEVFGVNRFMKAIADYWADEGFVAICPELYWRLGPGIVADPEIPDDRPVAMGARDRLDNDQCVDDIIATIAHARSLDACNRRVATSGYCLGGMLAYLTATRGNADANVSYYGVGIENHLDEADRIKTPLLLHIGEADPWTPEDVRGQLASQLGGPLVTQYLYADTGHAFARPGASTDVPDLRQLANDRTKAFLVAAMKGD